MHADPFVRDLVLLLGFAALGLLVFERLRLPSFAGFLVAGAIAGPGALGLVADPESIQIAAEFGVVLLLFEIGLELPLDALRRQLRDALLIGGAQVGGTTLVVALVAMNLGLSGTAALVVGMMAALSSTALVTRLLSERGQMAAPQGQLAFGVLLFQDAAFVPFLLAVPFLAGSAGGTLGGIGTQIAVTAATALIFFGVVRGTVPRLLDRIAVLRSPDLFSLLAILLAVGSGFVASQIGLSPAVGAFVTGVVAGSSRYSHQLVAEVVPLRGALLGLFFTAVGMLFEPTVLLRNAPLVAALLVSVVVVKSAITALAVRFLLRRGWRMALGVGLPLGQAGEFSFVLAAAATSAGILAEELQGVFVGVSVVSLVVTPFVLPLLERVGSRDAGRTTEVGGEDAAAMAAARHTVLIGFGLSGQALARVLRALGREYRALDSNPRSVRDLGERGEPVIYGDAMRPSVLRRLDVAGADLVVVAINDPVATERVVALVRELAPRVTIVARSPYVAAVDRLAEAGADSVIVDELESALELVSETLGRLGIPQEAVQQFTGALRDEGYEAIRGGPTLPLDPWLIELLDQVATERVEVPESFDTATLGGLHIRARTGVNVLIVERVGERISNPNPQSELRPGDQLLVLGNTEQVARLRRLLDDDDAA